MMKELFMEFNPLELKVFINEYPSINLVPKDTLDLIISELDKQIQDDAKSFIEKPSTA